MAGLQLVMHELLLVHELLLEWYDMCDRQNTKIGLQSMDFSKFDHFLNANIPFLPIIFDEWRTR